MASGDQILTEYDQQVALYQADKTTQQEVVEAITAGTIVSVPGMPT